jgi:hypothetical protein
VFDSLALSLVKIVTRAPPVANSIAARKPATPLPMTTKSVSKAIKIKILQPVLKSKPGIGGAPVEFF